MSDNRHVLFFFFFVCIKWCMLDHDGTESEFELSKDGTRPDLEPILQMEGRPSSGVGTVYVSL